MDVQELIKVRLRGFKQEYCIATKEAVAQL